MVFFEAIFQLSHVMKIIIRPIMIKREWRLMDYAKVGGVLTLDLLADCLVKFQTVGVTGRAWSSRSDLTMTTVTPAHPTFF